MCGTRCGTQLCLLLLLQMTLAWSLPLGTRTQQTHPDSIKFEANASNCIEPNRQAKVILPCTYTGVDYDMITVKWYRVAKSTGCCAKPAADYKYWKVPVNLVTLKNHTAQSMTVQLVIDHFSSLYSGLYFCRAYNVRYPNTHIQAERITELTLTGSPTSPSLYHCTEQNSSQCDVPAPDFNPTSLCAQNDDQHVCKPYSLRGITTVKYNSREASTTFQMHWTKPAIRCPGYSWRMRLCQSDALVSQIGITQRTSSDNHTDTIKCTAPWDNDFQPNNEYWKFYLQKNQHYIIQTERFSENMTESTLFTSPSLFVGNYEEPFIYCPRTVTTRKGTPVTVRCVITGNPKPRVTFLQALLSVGNTALLQTRTNVPKSQSDNPNNRVDNDIDGQWEYNLTVTPQQNTTYLCTATNSINRGWGNREEQVTRWINVIVTDE